MTIDPERGTRISPFSPLFTTTRDYWSLFYFAAHEYGHDLLGEYAPQVTHLDAMQEYSMMDGNGVYGNGPVRMSTWLRHGLGWMTGQEFTTDASQPGSLLVSGEPITIRLTDATLNAADSSIAIVHTADPEQYFILECSDSSTTTFFSGGGCQATPDPSGLMIYHAADKAKVTGGWNSNGCGPPIVEPEAAQGMWTKQGAAWGDHDRPDPTAGWDVLSLHDDLWALVSSGRDFYREGAGEVSIIAPYTNPSTHLYWWSPDSMAYMAEECGKRREQSEPSGLTFCNIKWVTPAGTSPGGGAMEVTIRYDAPQASSPFAAGNDERWDGNVRLMSDIVIAEGDTLTVSDGAVVTVSAEQDLAGAGSEDQVELWVDGVLDLGTSGIKMTSTRDRGTTHTVINQSWVSGEGTDSSADPVGGDWVGLRVGASGDVWASGDTLRYVAGTVNLSEEELPDLASYSPPSGISFLDALTDFTFNQDLLVPSVGRTVPNGKVLGFLSDGARVGIDSSRVEISLEGELDLGTGVSLVSAQPGQAPGGWYGIRTPDLAFIASDTLTTIKHAAAAISVDGGGLIDLAGQLPGVAFEENWTDLGIHTDITLTEDVTIPDSLRVGFAPADTASGGSGIDPGRIELRVPSDWKLTLGNGVVLKCLDPIAPPGSWYGIRIENLTTGLGLPSTAAASIEGAAGALSFEGGLQDTFPDVVSLFSGSLAFSGNKSDLCFDRDLVVAAGDTVTVPAGWRVGFAANNDSSNGGQVDSLSEWIVNGILQFGDLGGEKAAVVSNSVGYEAMDWGGIVFNELPSVSCSGADPGWGFLGSCSAIENTEIGNAAPGITITSLAAPRLEGISFIDGAITDSIDILLDSTDVVIPYESTWNLEAPVHVVATDSSVHDHDWGGIELGEPGKVDLIVEGALVTSGSNSSRVTFRPTNANDSVPGQWGGIHLHFAEGTDLRYAHVHHAVTPVFASDAGNFTIADTKVDYFGGVGVVIFDFYGSVLVDSVAIMRHASVKMSHGWTGILLGNAVNTVVKNCTFEFHVPTVFSTYPGRAIAIEMNDKTNWCTAIGGGADTLFIQGNRLIGSGADRTNGPAWSGVEASDWGCSQGNKVAVVRNNEILDWPSPGVKLSDCQDMEFLCNNIWEMNTAVWFSRPIAGAGEVLFNGNRFAMRARADSAHLTWTDNSEDVAYGSVGGKGGNTFELEAQLNLAINRYQHMVVEEDDQTNTDLKAIKNFWVTGTKNGATKYAYVTAESLATDQFLTKSPGGVQATIDTPDTCYLESGIQGPGGPGRVAWGGLVPIEDAVRQKEHAEAIETLALSAARPLPFSDQTSVVLTVPSAGVLSAAVYDVLGRRVAVLAEERPTAPGRYDIIWRGQSGDGRSSAAGVYFLKVDVSGRSFVRKVVKVR